MKKLPLLGGIIALSLVLLAGIVFVYEYSRVLPAGVYLGESSLEGMNRGQVHELVKAETEKLKQMAFDVSLNAETTKRFLPHELGISYDAERTYRKIFDDNSFFVQFLAGKAIASEENSQNYQPIADINETLLSYAINMTLRSHEKNYQDAQLVWNEGRWEIQSAQPGLQLVKRESERVQDMIMKSVTPFQESVTIAADYEVVPAQVFEHEIHDFSERVREVSEKPLVLVFGREESELRLADDPNWLHIDPVYQTYSLNEDYVGEWVQKYVAQNNVERGEVTISDIQEVTSEYDGKVYKKAVYEGSFADGKSINAEKLLTDLKTLALDIANERRIDVEWETIHPHIVSQVEGYEFPTFLSKGISDFRYGNHPNRVKNIQLSLGAFQGVVVEPGEELSFNRVTGWVTSRKGYTVTKVILEGRVQSGLGGGVCQTSTTIYRGILNAGMPITERRNHSLDIVYYHAYGHGLDATVYTDTRNDLKFVNDFDHPVLINTYTIGNEAYVEFYGTTDHRTVELNMVGNYPLYKKWEQVIHKPDEEDEVRTIESRYSVPKPETEEEANPLEA